jgi:hypothetical protein
MASPGQDATESYVKAMRSKRDRRMPQLRAVCGLQGNNRILLLVQALGHTIDESAEGRSDLLKH